jgi:hypothetical protein
MKKTNEKKHKESKTSSLKTINSRKDNIITRNGKAKKKDIILL